MSQSARSMMPNQSMSTLLRAFAIMSACGLAMPALGAGPTSGSRPFNQDTTQPGNRPSAAPKNIDELLALPLRSGTIVISAKNPSAFQFEAPALIQAIPNVSLVRVVDADLGVYELLADTTLDARAAYDILVAQDSIRSVQLDWDSALLRNGVQGNNNTNRKRHQVTKNPLVLWPGVTPNPADESGSRGGVTQDPQFGTQWHFVNPVEPLRNRAFDNNIPFSIYQNGLSGSGIQVAFSNLGINTHIDPDHTELDGGFRDSLTMTFDPGLFPDSTIMTSLAGALAAEIDGSGVQGVAPGVEFGNFNWPAFPSSIPGAIPLFEFEAFSWLMPEIDIKVYDTGINYYDDPAQGLNRGSTVDYVPVPFRNSFSFGRGRKGTINIFGTGSNPNAADIIDGVFAPGWPDPYNFPPGGATWSPLDALFSQLGNASATTLTNDWIQPPFYPNAQVANYPPANDRRAFIFQTVAEDGFADIFAGQGPSVFASFFGGTTNRTRGGSPTNLFTTVPGAGNTGFFPANTEVYPNESETMSGAMIGAGVIALMLEINPNLSIRDIQHILFESIQESSKDPNIRWPQFDNTRTYLGNGGNSFWQVNSGFYTGGPITQPQAIRHSDIFGFGVVDVDLALQKAANWQRVPNLIRLDTGLVGTFSDAQVDTETEIEIDIDDAEIVTLLDADGELGIDGVSFIAPGLPAALPAICVRQNLTIEGIALELTIEGDGNEDLFIQINSPSGTSSIVKMPSTNNTTGVTIDGDPNTLRGEVVIGNTGYSLYRHSFLTWKHWGELSGGVWGIQVIDYGPDMEHPEGEEPETGMDPTPGADHILFMGLFGVPGSENRSEKTITGYRFEIFGTESGVPIFEGCDPGATSCPADLDGNGIIDYRDLQIYVYYFQEGNAIADIDGDGDIDYTDLLLFRGLWQPGFCNGGQFGNGRPRPGDTNAGGDNNPSTRPI